MTKRIGILDDRNKLSIEDYDADWEEVYERSFELKDSNVRVIDELALVIGDSDEEVKMFIEAYFKREVIEM